MFSVSLHGISLHALVGLYPEEQIKGNDFEIDVDVQLPDVQPWFYADYTLINDAVREVFSKNEKLMETCVLNIHIKIKELFPAAEKIKIAVKKLHPPMPGNVAFSMVCYEA